MSNVLIDWLTFSSKSDSPESIIDLLGLQNCEWNEMGGRYYYQNTRYSGHVYIYYNGVKEDMGVCVEMSGQGCRDFESYSNVTWDKLLEDVVNDEDKKITRIDIAYDDFDRLLDLDIIANETLAGNFTSRLTHWNVQKGSRGCTVEHGLRSSRAYIRIYDKKAERHRDDIDYWVRCEIQLRDVNASGFGDCLYGKQRKPIQQLYFEVINNYIRYVEPGKDLQKYRWKTAEHWARFLESLEKQSVFVAPGVDYNFMKLSGYIFGQAGNAIRTYIDMCGAENFLHEVANVKPSKNKKYDMLRQMYKTFTPFEERQSEIHNYIKANER